MAEQDDIFSKYGGVSLAGNSTSTSSAPVEAPVKQEPTGDVFSKYGGHALDGRAEPNPVQFTQAPEQKGFEAFGGVSLGSPESELNKPQIHPGLSSNSENPDPSAPWYKRLWEGVNTPLFDAETAKNIFGWDVDHWNGWGKGLFDLATGFTSPLQIALTIGTFGAGSVFESAGAAALKGIMSADEIAQVTRGSKLLSTAIKMGSKEETTWAAMADMGIDTNVVKNGLETIAKSGLKPEAMMAEGLIRRTGGAMLRQAGVDVGKADVASHLAQIALDAGFSIQNAYGAAIAAPQMLDAIKSGDYEEAKRLGIEALGSGAFAVLGGRQIHQHAGELMTDAEAFFGLRVKPSYENAKIIRLLEPMERERIIAGEREKQWEKSTREQFKDINPEGDLRARFYRESEGNLQEWHDAIEKSTIKDKERLLRATDPTLLTDREKEYAKYVGQHFDETGTRALGAEALPALADNYVTRVWKDPENDTIKKFRATSSSPDFSVNTSMARKRIFESTLEGLLKGHELADHDMISLAAFNGNEFSKIVSARRALARLRGAGARSSDGRPITAISGSGHVVESYDEQGNPVNPATVINPQAMQGVRMANKVVKGLAENISKQGDESRYAYRLRDVGEQGVKSEGHAQLTTRFEDMERWWESRSQNPQEMVRIPLDKLAPEDYTSRAGPNGGQWITLNRDLNEAELERLSKEHKPVKSVTELDKLLKEGRVARIGTDNKGRDIFAWTTHDYKTVDHPSFRGWKVPTTDTDGNPIFVQGELRVHPEAEEYLNRRFGADEGLVKKIPGLKQTLGAAREAKGLLLAFSPFHIVQEGLRALMTGISPFTMERFDSENPMHVLAAEKGVWEMKDYKGVKAFEDGLTGHSKLISKVPVLREIQHHTQEFLFDKYIPALKLRAFERMHEANTRLHPDWTKEKIANESADEVNERFGGIPYRRIGRSAATMDLARLITLAPDWLESEMRFMKRVFVSGEEGALARRDVLKMTAALWAASRVLNYLISGKAHNEAPFGVAVKDDEGREKVYSVRTMPGDMLHAIQDPLGFMNGRVAPLLKTGIQTYTGRDEFGRKMDRNGIFVNLIRNIAPIGIQGLAKTATGQDTQGITTADQLAKAGGLTVFPYRTEGQKLAARLASDHAETGVVDKDKLRRHQSMLELEDRVRQGKTPITDVYKAVEDGQIHPDEARKMLKTLQETSGMDTDMARFYIHATRLPMNDLISVWDKAGSEEKAALSKLLIKKKNAYMKKAFKEMSPSERQTDSTYQWIKRYFPADPLGLGEIKKEDGSPNNQSGLQKQSSNPLQTGNPREEQNSGQADPSEPKDLFNKEIALYKDVVSVPNDPKQIDSSLENSLPPFLRNLRATINKSTPFTKMEGAVAHVPFAPYNDRILVDDPPLFGKGVLAHEMTHVFQGTRQTSFNEGDRVYEGPTPESVEKLKQMLKEGKTVANLTLEDDAYMLEDYYRINLAMISLAKEQGNVIYKDQAKWYEGQKEAYEPFMKQLASLPSKSDKDINLPKIESPSKPSSEKTGFLELSPTIAGILPYIPVKDRPKK